MIKDILKTCLKLFLGRGVMKSYSQNGEDILIWSLVKNIKKGIYIDVGAFHPVLYSNTYLLYKKGWIGIVIEPNPRAKPLFKFIRPKDKFVQNGVGMKSGILKYFRFSDPAYNTFSSEQAIQWENNGIRRIENLDIPVKSLKDIILNCNVKNIDVLSIDVEGLDLEVLSSSDWSIHPKVIVIESHDFDLKNPNKNEIYSFLINKGYRLEAISGFSLLFKI